MVFHAAKSSIWNAFASSLKAADLEIEMSNILDKTQASFKQVVSKGGVQGDPLFLIKRRDSSEETCSTSLEILKQFLPKMRTKVKWKCEDAIHYMLENV